jgi:hypothetical protein
LLTGKFAPALSENAKYQLYLQGLDPDAEAYADFEDTFRQRLEDLHQRGVKGTGGMDLRDEGREYLAAERARQQLIGQVGTGTGQPGPSGKGDPRAAAMTHGEGVPAFVRQDDQPSQVPPNQNINQPTTANVDTPLPSPLINLQGQPTFQPETREEAIE